jgi:hypothetical protein
MLASCGNSGLDQGFSAAAIAYSGGRRLMRDYKVSENAAVSVTFHPMRFRAPATTSGNIGLSFRPATSVSNFES